MSIGIKHTYTLGEAAELLSCHKETIRRAIKDGSLQAAKLGRGYRVSRFDLEAFWQAQGGGVLFEKVEQQVVESEPEPEPEPVEAKHKKPRGPEQLTLPT
ncbi:helix-turn-helix domain-containing protein [Halodesulfovibrio sp.]|uniref:helix-turn-helix domain-containing protein n=1 Tax=Halodesulfovibrio sp. TaxID=1912772 RepID=UPI0025DAA3FD|nr:helix-turn-helix domain-containing protein [Halodesulfovibrio sp.]MCT4534619.1 helix-turn-helix domain-containing protein [Halodesulfovibrio sp.]MCT4628243.1 helix-turn-helix domain-containing protein [Halodesulfovibrio sp.]